MRQHLSYSRFDQQELTPMLVDLYTSVVWRVLRSLHASEQARQKLRERFQGLNPFELQQQIREKMKPILAQVSAAAAAVETTPIPEAITEGAWRAASVTASGDKIF